MRIFFLVLLCSTNFPANAVARSESRIRVGVYYFGGWQSGRNYHLNEPNSLLMTPPFLHRQPLAGWYGDKQEVVDQEIAWAVRGGIDFFAFLWYWPAALSPDEIRNNVPLEYFLNSKTRSRKKLSFSIVYTNHDHYDIPPGDGWNQYSNLWIEWMSRKDYVRITAKEGEVAKPLFIIWSPQRFHEHWASFPGGAKAALNSLKAKAIKKGLPGINIGGVWEQTRSKAIIKEDGYDFITAYGLIGAGNAKENGFGQYESLVLGHISVWDSMVLFGSPVIQTITSGWDPRPWLWEIKGGFYYPDRTPEKFRRFCYLARDWLNTHHKDVVVPKTVLIYAWNELGEGGYIVPTVGDSFAYLDVLKKVFKSYNFIPRK